MANALLISALSCAAWLPLAAHAQPEKQPAPQEVVSQPAAAPVEFTIGDAPRQYHSSDARGRFLAVHFLTGAESDAAFLSEYASALPTLAGLSHVFVHPGSSEQCAALVKSASPVIVDRVYHDGERKLPDLLRIQTSATTAPGRQLPAIVLLDPGGKELLRKVGDDDGDRFHFTQLAAAMRKLSADPQTRHANIAEGVSIQGYDPVAYIRQNKAIKGDPSISSMYRGLTYRFATGDDRDAFNSDPDRYLPAYGGWCATAMAKGEKVEIDPTDFKVTAGRTFLFYNGFWGDARKDWIKDEPGMTTMADDHWKALITK